MDGRLLRLERPGSNGGYSNAPWKIANHPGLRISDAQIPATPPCILLQPGRDIDHLIDYLTRILNENFGAENGWTLWRLHAIGNIERGVGEVKRGPAGIPDRVNIIIVRKKLSQSMPMGGGHRQMDGSK